MAGEACAEGPAREGLTVPGSGSTASRASSARLAVAAVWRVESARIVATLVRTTGDFAQAEDLAQEALAEALEQWPDAGLPRNPAARLTAVAKRRAIDMWCRRDGTTTASPPSPMT